MSDLIDRHISQDNLDKPASSKQRRLYRELFGGKAPRNITKREINNRIVASKSANDIGAARARIKAAKKPSKYMRALLTELGFSANNRSAAESIIAGLKGNAQQRALLKAARRKLRGFTYAEDSEAGAA